MWRCEDHVQVTWQSRAKDLLPFRRRALKGDTGGTSRALGWIG